MFKIVKDPQSDLPNELLYGRVGFLYSLLFIKSCSLPHHFNDSDIKDVRKLSFKKLFFFYSFNLLNYFLFPGSQHNYCSRTQTCTQGEVPGSIKI